MKNKYPLTDIFDDTDDLYVTTDKYGLVNIKGYGILHDTMFKTTITRNETGNTNPTCPSSSPKHKPLYTGTISILSPIDNSVLISESKRRKKEAANKAYTKKDVYASIGFQCNSADASIIISTLRRQIDKLYDENKDQLNCYLLKSITPNKATPQFCVSNYLDDFIGLTYPNSTPERNASRKKKIEKIFASLPHIPMCKIKSREVYALINKYKLTSENTNLCHLFCSYLIDTKKCIGSNPFPTDTKRTASIEAQNKTAFTATELTSSVFEKMFELINKKVSTLYCGVVLLASGFSLSDICSLKWRHIEFVRGYNDFVIVHLHRDHYIAAMHDFSRPVIPDSGKYLKKVYTKLNETINSADLADINIVTTEYSDSKAADKKAIVNEANNILVRAGFQGRLSRAGRLGNEEPIPSSLLRTNYQRMLSSKAGLKNDPDTLNYLCGKIFNSSTCTNYESHTSPEAQYRLYTTLKPLSVEVPLKQTKTHYETNDSTIFRAIPKTNHEVTRIYGMATLHPGESAIIQIPHGVTGRIEILE